MITFERLQLLIFFSTASTFKSALIEKKENVQFSYQFLSSRSRCRSRIIFAAPALFSDSPALVELRGYIVIVKRRKAILCCCLPTSPTKLNVGFNCREQTFAKNIRTRGILNLRNLNVNLKKW